MAEPSDETISEEEEEEEKKGDVQTFDLMGPFWKNKTRLLSNSKKKKSKLLENED